MPELPEHRPAALGGSRFALLAFGILLGTNATQIYHWLATPRGARFLGNHWGNLDDLFTYVAWMKQAAQGHWLFLLLYDPTPQRRVIFMPLFLLLGKISAATGMDLVLALHVCRITASALLLVAARWLCRAFAPPAGQARAYLLLVLGSGLPGLMPEACPISSMFGSAIATSGWLLLILAAGSWILFCRTGRLSLAAMTGLTGGLLLFVHPFEAVPLSVTVLGTSVLAASRGLAPRRVARGAALVALLMSPAVAVLLYGLRENPCLARWAAEPRPFHGWEILSFGTILILALAIVACRRWRDVDPYVALWVASHLALALLPLPSSRRYLQGLLAPLALLASHGHRCLVSLGWKRLGDHLVVLAFPATAVMLLLDVVPIIPTPRYLPRGLFAEIARLEELPTGIIMAPAGLDFLIPPFSGRQVYAGHIVETPRYAERVRDFEALESEKLGSADLAVRGVRYLFVPMASPIRAGPGLREIRRERFTRLLEVTRP